MQPRGSSPKIEVFETPEEVAHVAASYFVKIAEKASSASGRFSVALAGGSTPKRMYELLASEEYRDRVQWLKVHIFSGDERCVPPDHRDSNYHMASETLISKVPVPPENVHRMRGEGDAEANALLYEDDLRSFFPNVAWPNFDLILLGMGDDGHTASLFPNTPALRESQAWVAANWVEKLNAFRVTLTAPAISSAANIIFAVTGTGKATTLSKVLRGKYDPENLPSQLIQPSSGAIVWLVDKAAAAGLQ